VEAALNHHFKEDSMNLGELREKISELDHLPDSTKVEASGCCGAANYDVLDVDIEHLIKIFGGDEIVVETTVNIATDVWTG